MDEDIKGRSDCPSCQGTGLIPRAYRGALSEWQESCPVCLEGGLDRRGYREIRQASGIKEQAICSRIACLTDAFSGRCKAIKSMSHADEEQLWIGAVGQEYRRLMKYLWAMPASARGVSDQGQMSCERCGSVYQTYIRTRNYEMEKLCFACAAAVRRDGQEAPNVEECEATA